MAGYSNNYGSGYAGGSGGNPPEYQDKPNADSLNGTYGTNTPAAKNNQQQQRSSGGNGNGSNNGNGNGSQPTDPYSAFHEASKGWWNRPAAAPTATAPVPAASTVTPDSVSAPSPASVPASAPAPALNNPLADTLRGASSAPSTNSSPANLTVSTPTPGTPDDVPPPAVVPPLPVDSSHPLHPDFLKSALMAAPQSQSIPNDGSDLDHPRLPNQPDPGGNPSPDGGPPPPPPSTGTSDPRTRPSAPPPVYDDAHPPPHPPEGASLTDITNYYRKFAYKNPAFGNITEQDVLAYWRDPKGMQIGDWYLAGNRGVNANPLDGLGMEKPPAAPPGTTPDTNPNPNPNPNPSSRSLPPGSGGEPNYYKLFEDMNAKAEAVAHPPGSPGGGPAASIPPPAPVPPPGPSATPPPGANPDDALSRTQHLYDPLFKQQRDDLARTLRAQGALDGSGDSGGFNESFGRSEARLSADQGAQLAGLTEAEQNRNQAMTIAVMNDATQRYGIKTNDDLQRWLNDPNNNTLQKYGIDKNLLMEKYKAELGLQGSQMIASASFSGAALQAATSKAIAEGNNQTQLSLGTMNNNLGYGQLQGNLYNEDQNRRIQEIQMLINAGVTPAVAAQIAASFGPAAPAYKP